MKILFAGGGTLGPVMPLLAVAEAWKKLDSSIQFLWVGTPGGPEKTVVTEAGIVFFSIPVARFPRYPTLEWLLFPFRFLAACGKTFWILRKEQPRLIASAGGFSAVPVVFIGWMLGIPSWIHQQDVRPLLSNRLCAPFAHCMTTTWQRSVKRFAARKTKQVGNPVRASILRGKKEEATRRFHLDPNLPTILILGGGTGSLWINHMMEVVGPVFVRKANVIHATGQGKLPESLRKIGGHYFVTEFLDEDLPHAYVAADVVLARAGMGTITELAALRKPAVIIPLPDSAQEDNAQELTDTGAAVVLAQSLTSAVDLQKTLLDLLSDTKKQRALSERIGALLATDVAETLVQHVRAHVGI